MFPTELEAKRFFWTSQFDAIAVFFTFVVFTLIICMLMLAGWMDGWQAILVMVFGAIYMVLIQLGTIQVKINLLGKNCLELEKELTSIKSKQYKESTEIKSRLRGIESVVVGIQGGL